MRIGRGIFVMECAGGSVPEALWKGTSRNGVTDFFHGIGFTELDMSCYPSTLLNKLAHFVQFLKEKLPPNRIWVSVCIPEPISL
jgi:hypothetical protein